MYITLARSLIGCRTNQSTGDLYLEPGQLIWMSTGRIPKRRIPQCHNNISCQIATMWCPLVINWFINPINYSYICHKP